MTPEPGQAPALPQRLPETAPPTPPRAGTLDPPSPSLEGDCWPAQVGRYQIEGEIARGGMGVVLRAHDLAFQRTLAVKVLLDRHQDRPELAQRFLEEAQVMG